MQIHAQTAPSANSFAIVGVNVVPMDQEGVLENQSVIVIDGRIDRIGDVDDTLLPDGIRVIDGEGRYLMPGFADLHTHLRRSDEYVNYLHYGVTTVMHLGGSESRGRSILRERSQIEDQEIIGPNIYATERIIDGDPRVASNAYSISSVDFAREKVAELKASGFDLIKIYNNVSKEVFDAIVGEARKQNMPVFGHVPRNFDPLEAMRGGQDAVVHTEEFFFTYFKGPRSTKNMDRGYRPDLSMIPELVKVLVENDVAIMPDLSFTFTNFLMWDGMEMIHQDGEMKYQHPNTLADWQQGINRRREIENFIIRGQWKYNLMQELTRAFQEAGILQVVGTDASVTGLFPGKSVHRELTELVKAGLSNYDVLSIGTRNAGDFIRKYIDDEHRFGQIKEGYRADLLLLADNPLEDVRNARKPSAVVVNGRWIESSVLEQSRSDLAARFSQMNEVVSQVDLALKDEDAVSVLRDLRKAYQNDDELVGIVRSRINSVGYTAAFADDLERAQVVLELATEVFPESANAWDSLAEIHLEQGHREKAIELYRKALEVDPDFSNAADQLEKILASVE